MSDYMGLLMHLYREHVHSHRLYAYVPTAEFFGDVPMAMPRPRVLDEEMATRDHCVGTRPALRGAPALVAAICASVLAARFGDHTIVRVSAETLPLASALLSRTTSAREHKGKVIGRVRNDLRALGRSSSLPRRLHSTCRPSRLCS